MKDTTLIGDIVEFLFQYEASRRGIGLSKPVGNRLKYDFITDLGEGNLKRVQVKKAVKSHVRQEFKVDVRHGFVRRKYKQNEVDIFSVYCKEYETWYHIPMADIKGATINVYPQSTKSKGQYEKHKNNWKIFNDVR